MKAIIETPALLTSSVPTTLSNWDVIEKPVLVDFNGEHITLPNQKAIIRTDTGKALNVCKGGYTPYSNAQFIDVVERFGQITKFPVEAIMELQDGKKMLGYLKCTEPMTVGGFEFRDHLMIGNSHDGSTGFFVGNSNIMVRCENRFAKEFRQLKAKHTQTLHVTVEEIVNQFKKYQKDKEELYAQYNRFAKVKVDKKLITDLKNRLANLTNEEILGTAEISTKKANIICRIEESFEREMDAIGHDLLGLFGGVTHYTTHTLENHALGVNVGMFDRGSKLNSDAYDWCKRVADLHLN